MEYFIYFLQLMITLFTVYHFVISLFCLVRRPEVIPREPRTRFAVVIAAHNEEKVIGALVKSIFQTNYPRNLYEVFVVADNCTDRTASIAAECGATVIERYNPNLRGKGYALEYAFNQIIESGKPFDAFVIFDADNLVSPNFFRVMDGRVQRGEKIIQGYLDTKNPDDTWITRSICVGYILTNRFWQLGKYNLGLSCALGGTGMCITVDVIREIGWGMTSLTEDLEFQTKALLCGYRVTWAHDAVVYDEKPLTLKASWRQRKRWMQGHCNVAARYFARLLLRGIKERNMRLIDGAIYLVQPYFTMAMGIALVYSVFYTIDHWEHFNLKLSLAMFVIQYCYFSLALYLERAKAETYIWLIYYPLFTLTWIPVTYAGFFSQHNKIWDHTQHVRSIEYANLRTVNKNVLR